METVKILEKKGNLEKNKILGKHWPQCLFLMSKNIDFEIGELYYLQHSSSKCHPVVTTTTTPVSSSSLVCVSHSHTPVNILSFAIIVVPAFVTIASLLMLIMLISSICQEPGTISVYVVGRGCDDNVWWKETWWSSLSTWLMLPEYWSGQ